MKQDTHRKIQKEEGFKEEFFPNKKNIFKIVDFRKQKVASPSELINEQIKDKEQIISTSLSDTENSAEFSWTI
jgi:hypothetical protein